MAEKVPTDVFDAFYRVVHDFGVEDLAKKLAMPAGTLYNKANQNESSHHKPTLADAVVATVITKDHRILHAFAHTVGEVCFPIPDLSNVSDVALLELITKIGAEGGDFYREINKALAHSHIRKDDLKRIQLEAFEFISAIAETVARIEGLVDE